MIEIFILSLVQGITEFLPVSSSSHLIIISEFLNFDNQSLSLDVSLHIGSFIAVVFYFWKDIKNFLENKILFFKIFISSIPVMLIGLTLVKSGQIEKIRNLEVIAWTTLIFGFILYLSDKFKLEREIKKDYSLKIAILIGIFQVFSLIPGVSRSGIAITTARFLNFKRVEAAKISFLISIPILAAVSFYGISNIIITNNIFFTKINLFSIFLSFLFSLITIKYFLKYINKFSLSVFVYYRVVLGLIFNDYLFIE